MRRLEWMLKDDLVSRRFSNKDAKIIIENVYYKKSKFLNNNYLMNDI